MNQHVVNHLPNGARLAVQQVLRSFLSHGGLAGLFVTGSMARGLPEPDDLDLVAIWDDPLSDDDRGRLVASCRGNHVGDPDTDRFHLHGVVPEFHFMAGKQQVADMLADFCWKSEPPPESDADRAEGLLASLSDALPVHDPECLAHSWQKMLNEDYPDEYRRRRVHEQYTAACRRLAHLCRCGAQRDVLYRLRGRLEFIEYLVKALVSLNRTFYWGPKWNQAQLDRLRLKPDNMWERVSRTMSGRPNLPLPAMRSLALDTGSLIRLNLPGVDISFSTSIIQQISP